MGKEKKWKHQFNYKIPVAIEIDQQKKYDHIEAISWCVRRYGFGEYFSSETIDRRDREREKQIITKFIHRKKNPCFHFHENKSDNIFRHNNFVEILQRHRRRCCRLWKGFLFPVCSFYSMQVPAYGAASRRLSRWIDFSFLICH